MSDALLSPAIGMAFNAVSAGALVFSAAKAKKDELSEKNIPLMGIAGALVFAGQMINFAIPGTGSSGHIGGGILLAGLLGGFPAFLSITAVLIIQCLFFADGGLLALGCNIFNLGAIPCLVVYPLLFRPLIKKEVGYRRLSLASVVSVVAGLELGAFCVVLQTSASGITQLPFGVFLTFMLPIHLAIGVVEGIVTAGILCFVFKMRPEILEGAKSGSRIGSGAPVKKVLAILAVLTVVAGGVFSIFASANPDGLEWAIGKTEGTADMDAISGAQTSGADTETVNGAHAGGADTDTISGVHAGAAAVQNELAFLPDYGFDGTYEDSGPLGASASGIIGAAITFVLAGATGFILSIRKKTKA